MRPKRWASFDRTAMHRPIVTRYWVTAERYCISLSWGSPYGDPVWCIGFEVPWTFRERW